jgi:hypothetical protein
MQQASEKAGELKDLTREKVRDFAHQARSEANAFLQRFKDQGEDVLQRQKDVASGSINSFAVALQGAADKLHDEGNHNIAGYAEDLSRYVERASGYLRDRDLRGMIDDCTTFIRRRPGLFFGGMFVAGLAAARFLKASRRREQEISGYGYDRGEDWAGTGGQGFQSGVPTAQQGMVNPVTDTSGRQTQGDISGSADDAFGMAGASPTPASPGISSAGGASQFGSSPAGQAGFESSGGR